MKKVKLVNMMQDNIINKYFSYSVIFLPFLYQYIGIQNIISLGEIILLITTLLALIKDNFKLSNINKKILIFYIISLSTTSLCMFFDYFSFSAAGATISRLVLYAIVIIVARKHFSIKYIEKPYKSFVFFLSLYLLIQYFFNKTTGGYLPIYLDYDLQFPPEARPSDLSVYYRWFYRSSSLFLEPGYFVFYVMPLICMLIFKIEKSKFEILTLLLTILAVLLSTSSSGVIILAIIFLIYLLRYSDKKQKQHILLKLVIILCAAITIIVYITSFEVASFTIDRLINGGSFDNRITRGYLVYFQLPIFHQLVGVGINNIESYMNYNGIITAFDEGNLNYAATITQVLNYSGIFGFLSLLYLIYSLTKRIDKIKNNRYNSNLLLSFWTILSFSMIYEAVIFNYRFAFYFILFEGIYKYFLSERDEF